MILYYIYETAFSFWDTGYAAALTVVLLVILGAPCTAPVRISGAPNPLSMNLDRKPLVLEEAAAWLLGLLWVIPLLFALWAAVHPTEFASRFVLDAPLTFDNFVTAWHRAPFPRYFLKTFLLVTLILAVQFVICTLAAYAFARVQFPGADIVFALVLIQLMITPDVLIVENYRSMARMGLLDTITSMGLPYMASAFGIFLLRQNFKTGSQ